MNDILIIDIGFDDYIMQQVRWPTRLYKGAWGVGKKDLIEWLTELGIDYKATESKEDLINKLIAAEQPLDFYNRFKDRAFGVHPVEYIKRFNLTTKEVRKMKDTGFLKVAYTISTRLYSKPVDVPMYDLEQYFKLTKEDIETWRKNVKN